MATTSQPNQESRELTRLFHQTKKTHHNLMDMDMTGGRVKLVLNTIAGYEPNHESPPFSINRAKNVTANLISATAAIQDPKYHVSPNNSVLWLRRLMKAQNINYANDSYLEGIHITRDEKTDVSQKHRLWFLKLKGAIHQQIEKSLAQYRKMLIERSSNFERSTILRPKYKAPDTKQFCYASPIQFQYP